MTRILFPYKTNGAEYVCHTSTFFPSGERLLIVQSDTRHWEVWKTHIPDPHPLSGKTDKVECPPRSESWGRDGFTLTSEDAAWDKFREILAMELEKK